MGFLGQIEFTWACMFLLITTEFYGPWVKEAFSWLGTIDIISIRGRQVAYIWGINNISVGIFGIPAAFIFQWLFGIFAKPATAEMQEFIESIRVPSGAVKNVGQMKAE